MVTTNPTHVCNLDSVQEQIARAANFVSSYFSERVRHRLSFYQTIKSPIEAVFAIWWDALLAAHETSNTITWQAQHDVVTSSGRRYRLDFRIIPDAQIAHRAGLVGVPIHKIGVELDGHDFHERTKEQVAQRNTRDRDLRDDGWEIIHFSGSEIYRDPESCVRYVFSRAYDAFGFDFERRVNNA